MRNRLGITAACVLGFAAGAGGQFPQNPYGQQYPFPNTPFGGGGLGGGGFGGNQGAFMPNIYNPQTQPLSPYLNLNRGGNPAVNYFYGVRPGTVGGFGGMGGAAALAPGGNRAPFFPQLTQVQDPLDLPGATEGYVLPPAGHPVVYNNTLGYFPYPFGMRGFGSRSGLGGVGSSRPPATQKK
jgi:hypothetical protein